MIFSKSTLFSLALAAARVSAAAVPVASQLSSAITDTAKTLSTSWGGLHFSTPAFVTALSVDWPYPNSVIGYDEDWGGIHDHDPSIVKYNGYYYVFSTHNLVAMARAPSLYGPWEHLGSVLSTDSIIDLEGRNDTWAPDVHQVGDTFYCFYSVSTFGSQYSAIGLATSKTLQPGSWTDHGAVIESGADKVWPYNTTNAIDPSLLVEFDKKGAVSAAYLTYGSFWSDIFQIELNKDLTVPADAASKAKHLSFDPNGTNPEEGAYIHKASNGWYYLFVSHGTCCGYSDSLPAPGVEYKVLVGRSKSASGPYLDKNGVDMVKGGGSVFLGSHGHVYGPGGEGVLVDGSNDIFYYHYVDTRISLLDADKLLGWNIMKYDSSGWPYLT
ncbi:glycosyl hydrolase [Dipodascopsis tothii]|uniref:glycosyl hydrolase n=1 Tax=Dipodascopsis tothii TaxID=44089 RepID=UPI0034CE66EB